VGYGTNMGKHERGSGRWRSNTRGRVVKYERTTCGGNPTMAWGGTQGRIKLEEKTMGENTHADSKTLLIRPNGKPEGKGPGM